MYFFDRIPVVTVTPGEAGKTELEISDDPYDCKRIDTNDAPIIVTLNKVSDSALHTLVMNGMRCGNVLLIGRLSTFFKSSLGHS